tara:strand:- start:13 stop:207 length:195 start_codon:yes stop_codon:yes gene_type:complete
MSRYGYSGKGKNKRCNNKELKSVYAAETYSVLKKTPKKGCGKSSYSRRNRDKSLVFNPKTYGVF